MVCGEQIALRDVLASLSDDDWYRLSLCGTWQVRDVVAHLISMNEAGVAGLLQATVSIHWFNATGVARRASMTSQELLAAFDRAMGIRGLGRVVPASAMLVEVLAHSQDIRRPLGIRRDVPPERLVVLLPRCVSVASYVPGFGFTGGRRRVRGLRLRATNLDWSWGHGPLVAGPAEALLMAVLGRATVVDELFGDGFPCSPPESADVSCAPPRADARPPSDSVRSARNLVAIARKYRR